MFLFWFGTGGNDEADMWDCKDSAVKLKGYQELVCCCVSLVSKPGNKGPAVVFRRGFSNN